MTPSAQSPTLLLVDGLSLVFQAFYAIRGLTNAQGVPTGAVLGFTRAVQKMLSTFEPSHAVVAFDSPGPSFRKAIYDAYKANREEAPEDFHQQLPYVFRILDAMQIPRIAKGGFEADDLIGTLARRADAEGLRVLIATADKDLFQLVNDHVSVLRTRKDDMQVYGPAEVRERMGVPPEKIVSYLALVGDTSDNIPGIPKVGPKTATALLQEFATLDEILNNLDRVANARQRALIEENAELGRLSARLATIDCAVDIETDWESFRLTWKPDAPELVALYRELGFTSLLRELKAAPATTPSGLSADPDAASVEAGFGVFAGAPEQEPQPKKAAVEPDGAVQYRAVLTEGDLCQVADEIRRVRRVALDTETTSVDAMTADLVGISLSVVAREAWYIPVGHRIAGDAGRQLSLETVREALGPVLADPAIAKLAHNAKYDLRILARHSLPVQGLTCDTMLASYVLNPERRHGLKALALELLGGEMQEIDSLIGRGKNAGTMDLVEIDRVVPYACADADLTLRLAELLEPQLAADPELDRLFREIEMPLVEVLDDMEAEGVTVDTTALAALSRDLHKQAEEVARSIYDLAGHPFSINSPKQVADVLFGEIGLQPQGKTASGAAGKNQYSTKSEVLEELSLLHPLPKRLLEYRHLDKLLSTYVDALPQMVNPRTGRVHTSFNQFIAATGRLSSSSPNLQNIPARGPLAKTIRRAFVPNGPNQVLLAADYSQIELRVMAHLSQDPGLIRAFVEGTDIHMQTATRIFDTVPELVTSDMRSQAKVVNFGVLYGMSAHRLSRELTISRPQAQKFIDEYFEAYPGVRTWSESLIEEAKRTGYVKTLSGRRRNVPNLNVRNKNEQANAIRMAVNTPVQGTAADLIKIAMIRLYREMRRLGVRAKMVLQVHDELVFSLPREEVDAFEPVVRRIMENALPLQVPLVVDVQVGKDWSEC
jgi:DNA polymerase-1